MNFSLDNPGTYEARYLKNNGYNSVAASSQFTVEAGAGDGTYTLAVSPEIVITGEHVTVSWVTPPDSNNLLDWVGLYEVGANDADYADWRYTLLRGGDTRFLVSTTGAYEFRYFKNNKYTKVATSQMFVVVPTVPNPNTITNYPSSGANIIALGDSIVKGNGSSPGEDFVSELSRRINRPIINKGVSGDTTRDVLARLEADVLTQNPKVVILFVGGNDFLPEKGGVDIPEAETFQNIKTMIDRIHQRGSIVIMLGYGGDKVFPNRWETEYRAIADATRSAFIPNIMRGIFFNPFLLSDLVHPNDKGYDIIALRIEPVIKVLIDK